MFARGNISVRDTSRIRVRTDIEDLRGIAVAAIFVFHIQLFQAGV